MPKTLDPTTASSQELRAASEHAAAWARKAEEREREQAIVAEQAAQRLAQERHEQNRARLQAMTLPPEPIETKQGAWEGELELKAESWGQRTLTVLASCFNVRDLGGDLVPDHAYDQFLQSDASKGVPILFRHNRDEPTLGYVARWEKVPQGLLAHVKIHPGAAGDRILAAAHGALEAARKTGRRAATLASSIGYVAGKVRWATVNGLTTRILDQIELRELSILNPGEGMCPGAGVLDAKSLATALTPPKSPAENRARLAARQRELEDEIYFLEQRQREQNDTRLDALNAPGTAARLRGVGAARVQAQQWTQQNAAAVAREHTERQERLAMRQRLAGFGIAVEARP